MAQYEAIDEAFSDSAELAERVHAAIRAHATDAPLYLDIANYISRLRNSNTVGHSTTETAEPETKRRKLENSPAFTCQEQPRKKETKAVFEARDLSFSIPFRKKLHLELAEVVLPTNGNLPSIYQIRALNPLSKAIEYEASLREFKYAFRLPIPEKVQKQHNFVLLSELGLGAGDKVSLPRVEFKESLVWTTSDVTHKSITFVDEDLDKSIQPQHSGRIEQVLNKCLEATPARTLVEPEGAEFSSAIPEAHRKGEEAYHVKAFRGSKDGYLFFLAIGIFFGFKKPLVFIPFEIIHSISYTSVLQRTFNLNIAVQLPGQEQVDEYEFSMLDQSDFAGVDKYVKRHQLQDSSLIESRRARKLNLNGARKGTGDPDADDLDVPGDLQKAQADLEDIEDADEEDYEPDSEDLTDGSGESSDHSETGEENSEGDSEKGEGDFVAVELGSKAEEVRPNMNDEEQL